MNSFYERIEALLNRCGLTISDIPGDIQSEAGTAEIIDRIETALENVCGERDYLLKEYLGCESCTAGEGARFDEEPCLSCENRSEFEWSIPEDWSVDNAYWSVDDE